MVKSKKRTVSVTGKPADFSKNTFSLRIVPNYGQKDGVGVIVPHSVDYDSAKTIYKVLFEKVTERTRKFLQRMLEAGGRPEDGLMLYLDEDWNTAKQVAMSLAKEKNKNFFIYRNENSPLHYVTDNANYPMTMIFVANPKGFSLQ